MKEKTFIMAVAFTLFASENAANLLSEKLRDVETNRTWNGSRAAVNNDDIQRFWKRTISETARLLRELISSASIKTAKDQIQNCSVLREMEDKCWCTFRREIVNIYFSAMTVFLETPPANLTGNVMLNASSIVEGGFRLFVSRVGASYKNVKEPLTLHNLFYSLHYDEPENISDNYFTIDISNIRDWFWGIIKAKEVRIYNVCEQFRTPELGTNEFKNYLFRCISTKLLIVASQLINCIDSSSENRRVPLVWNEHSVFFDTECLCVISDMKDCSTVVSSGVPDREHCIFKLLKDLQKHVTHRPAVTYMDYSLKTRVSIRSFSALLGSTFRNRCSYHTSAEEREKALCFFHGLVNKDLGCSNKSSVDNLDLPTICLVQQFLKFIVCRKEESEMQVVFYWYKHSPVTMMLASVDLLLRILTLLTYLSTRELRNLPGKIFIAYQITAILSIIFVFCNILEKNVAVYVDIYLDLVVICWLNAGSHFFYVSMKTLIVPSAYHPDLARMIFLKYAFYAWGLPAVLTLVFAHVDTVTESRFQYGQFGFVIACLSILMANIIMFYLNLRTYYTIKKAALEFRFGMTIRSYYFDFLNFFSKTLLLSGIGIFVRILIIQIVATEIHLNFCYIVSTSQGLILFIMFAFKQLRIKLSHKFKCRMSNFVMKGKRRLDSISKATHLTQISR